MTNEEKAEEMLMKCKGCIYEDDHINCDCPSEYIYLAGIAKGRKDGYEQGYEDCRHYAHDYYKPKWHDLRKDPNDLPENFDEPHFLCVLGEDFKGCMLVMFYNEEKHTFGMWGLAKDGQHKFFTAGKEIVEVIAWCELPKFEEK